MSDPLREAATRLADEWQHGTADDEYCERLDVACAALREALTIEPEYDYRIMCRWSQSRGAVAEACCLADAERELAKAEREFPQVEVYIERAIKAGEWERLP